MDSGDSQEPLQTATQPILLSGAWNYKGKKNMMNEIITSKHEYYDDVHFVWRSVPSFWVGDFVASHSHKIVFWQDIKK